MKTLKAALRAVERVSSIQTLLGLTIGTLEAAAHTMASSSETPETAIDDLAQAAAQIAHLKRLIKQGKIET